MGYRPWGLKESDATERAHTCVVWFCQKVPLLHWSLLWGPALNSALLGSHVSLQGEEGTE